MKWFLGVLLILGSWVAMSWALMLFVGVLHHELSPAIPAIGFWAAGRIELAFSLLRAVWLACYQIGKDLTK